MSIVMMQANLPEHRHTALHVPSVVAAQSMTVHLESEGATLVVKLNVAAAPALADALCASRADVRDKYGNRVAINRLGDVLTLQSVFADVVELKMRGETRFTFGEHARRGLTLWRRDIEISARH